MLRPTLNEKPDFIKPEGESKRALDRVQIRTINVLRGQSRVDSFNAYDKLLNRVNSLGYDENILLAMMEYMKSVAPPVVHFHPKRIIQFMLNDTHYRNLFEIGAGSGSNDKNARAGWEKACFLSLYEGAVPFEKPKYGALNILNNPKGVTIASNYGDSYFVLKDHVRIRTTIATGDTSGSRILGVLSYCAHVMVDFNDYELKSIANIVTNKIPYADYSGSKSYKEIQIHGELSFSKDIEKVVIDSKHKGDVELVEKLTTFCEQNGCSLNWH